MGTLTCFFFGYLAFFVGGGGSLGHLLGGTKRIYLGMGLGLGVGLILPCIGSLAIRLYVSVLAKTTIREMPLETPCGLLRAFLLAFPINLATLP